MMIDELERGFTALRDKVHDIRSYLDLPQKQAQLAEIEKRIADPAFWSDPEKSQKVMQERKRLEQAVSTDQDLAGRLSDLEALFELAREGEPVEDDIRREMDALGATAERLETNMLLSGENDARNAIVTLHPGAGGVESQDWAQMLMRMYLRWAEREGFNVTINDVQPGEEAGIKSATFTVAGENAYGLLQSETGVHRLVRISPFDSNARRHTSFASVFVYPEIDDEITVQINPDDLRVDTFCSSGPGGQGVNTTYSAVRLTHLPTGIVVQCQNERSQIKNKAFAMKILRSRLYELELERKREETKKLEASKMGIQFGSQIRSYVLAPYRLVKDHRTKFEMGDVDRVLDGDLEPFIHAYLVWKKTGAPVAEAAPERE
ncbi:MAG TPA: peptide chain release factor 2 [Bryobacterales bacterium]|nr:peptide chain release factor 2 [Bryobacterales bacterium]